MAFWSLRSCCASGFQPSNTFSLPMCTPTCARTHTHTHTQHPMVPYLSKVRVTPRRPPVCQSTMHLVVREDEGNAESGKQHPSVGAVMVGVGWGGCLRADCTHRNPRLLLQQLLSLLHSPPCHPLTHGPTWLPRTSEEGPKHASPAPRSPPAPPPTLQFTRPNQEL